jgi:hypothetical protein
MQVTTFEGIIENGTIRLRGNIQLPEKTRVYVIVPDISIEPVSRIFSPRLAHPEQASDFFKEVTKVKPNDSLR